MYSISKAVKGDLSGIVEIYNESVLERNATADLEPVSVASREAWFDAHTNNRPLFTLKENGEILAWASLSDYYARKAYNATAEISIYIKKSARKRGFGKILISYLINAAPNFGIKNIIALIFSGNAPSLRLFEGLGFTQWGKLPGVCELDGKKEDVVILGKTLKQEA